MPLQQLIHSRSSIGYSPLTREDATPDSRSFASIDGSTPLSQGMGDDQSPSLNPAVDPVFLPGIKDGTRNMKAARSHTSLLGLVLAGLFALVAVEIRAETAAGAPLGAGVPAFHVRDGYRVDLIAEDIGEVRFIEFGEPDTLYVSQPRTGAIITLKRRAGVWRKLADFTTGKPSAHGMHYHDGWLWFTQSGVVWKARDTDGDGRADEEIKITDDLPSGGGHWWRSILVTEDGFYTSIGDSGNLTDERDSERQKIWHFKPDGSGKTLFISGIRNTEKLRLRPGTLEVWGADHGSDNWGAPLGIESRGNQPFTDKLPPCEFNRYVKGGFYGHPFIVGAGLPRLEFLEHPELPDFAKRNIAPAWSLGAHWAPNGWNFVTGERLGLQGDAVIACHGSWNSSVRVGYCLLRILFDPLTGEAMGSQKLVSTITPEREVLGRPCDVAEAPDGSLYFSDDSRGRIYRLSRSSDPAAPAFEPEEAAPAPEKPAFQALSYFQAHCATCHGAYGAAYAPLLGPSLSDAQLLRKAREMTEQRAQAPLNERDLATLVEFLQALRDDRPYAKVTSRGADGVLEGEALPGTNVRINDASGLSKAKVQGHTWQFKLSDSMHGQQTWGQAVFSGATGLFPVPFPLPGN